MALVLVFIGFDYCPGLFFLTVAYYASSVIVVLVRTCNACPAYPSRHNTINGEIARLSAVLLVCACIQSTPPWIRAFFFIGQLVLTDGLFFWSALFGLQFHSWNHTGLPVQVRRTLGAYNLRLRLLCSTWSTCACVFLQMVLLAGMVRLVGSLVWVWNLRVRSGSVELDKIHSLFVSVVQHALIGIPVRNDNCMTSSPHLVCDCIMSDSDLRHDVEPAREC
jgi:hypothetical protein